MSIPRPTRDVTRKPTRLRLVIDKKPRVLPLAKLADNDYRQKLDREIKSSHTEVKVNLINLSGWANELRRDVLIFLAEHDGSVVFYLGQNRPVGSSLLDAVLQIQIDEEDVDGFDVIKTTALEIVGLLYPNAIEFAATKIRNRFREQGIRGIQHRQLVSDAKRVSKELDEFFSSIPDNRSSATLRVLSRYLDPGRTSDSLGLVGE